MSRLRSSLLAVTLIAGAISFTALLPNIAIAQCAVADQCSPATCRLRHNAVHPTCDQSRSCANIPANNKVELRRRLAINEQCLRARLDVSACFSDSDPGHDEAIQSVENAIARCQIKINQ